MELSSDDIKQITRLIADKLGSQASGDEVAKLVHAAVSRLSSSVASATAQVQTPAKSNDKPSRKLILNAFGPARDSLPGKIKSFIAGKALRITDFSTTNIDNFSSLIAIIDYSDYEADLTQLKFEFEKICSEQGFKAIIQDSSYYNSR